jgi:hypothetical protein
MSRSAAGTARSVCNSFLGGYCVFLDAGCVRVGQIRSILIWLIEHFSSAAGIFRIFLDQRRD